MTGVQTCAFRSRAKDECYDAYRGIWHGSPIGGFAVEQSGGKGGDAK